MIGSRKLNGTVRAHEIFIQGTNNTYSTGTIIAYWDTWGNEERGVTVEADSSLGTGPVTVQGTNAPALIGARLTLLGNEAIDDSATLDLIGGGQLVLPGTGQVETVGALFVNGIDAGLGMFGDAEYPDNIVGPGRIRVAFPQLDALILIVR